MKYKEMVTIKPTAKWLRCDGTEYPKCSVCGYLQDIWKDGSARCIHCGAWMKERYIKK